MTKRNNRRPATTGFAFALAAPIFLGLGLAVWRGFGEFSTLETAPGLAGAISLSLTGGLAATALACLFAFATIAADMFRPSRDRPWRSPESLLLAAPHAAVALGFLFLAAPNGFAARVAAPLAGWTTPPDAVFPQDSLGIGLSLGLAFKEALFLTLMARAALARGEAARLLRVARGLGHGPVTAWLGVVPATLYPRLRLPILAVLAYSASSVDMGLILGPTTPPTLAVMIARWAADPAADAQARAAAGGLLQLVVVAVAFGCWRLGERVAARVAAPILLEGRRAAPDRIIVAAIRFTRGAAILPPALAVAGLFLWSVAGAWRWPDVLPATISFMPWARALPLLTGPAWTSLMIGLVVAALAVGLGVALLEARRGMAPGPARVVLLAPLLPPLLVPQIAVLPGLQWPLVALDVDGTIGAVIAMQLVFVLPFALLGLSGPHEALDPRLLASARALGAGRWRVLTRITLPLLRAPLAATAAVAFAASVGQYQTTLFAGAGRVATLVTEALALSSGGDRRLIGAFAVAQILLPLAGFALAARVASRGRADQSAKN